MSNRVVSMVSCSFSPPSSSSSSQRCLKRKYVEDDSIIIITDSEDETQEEMDDDCSTVLLDEKDFIVNRLNLLSGSIRKLMDSDADFLFNKMTFKNILDRDRKLQSNVFKIKSSYAAKLQLDFKNANSKEDLIYTRKIESLTVTYFMRQLIYRQLKKSTIELFYNKHDGIILGYTTKRISDAMGIVEKCLSVMEKELVDYWTKNESNLQNSNEKIYYNFVNDFLIWFITQYIIQAVKESESSTQMGGRVKYIVHKKYMTLDMKNRKSKSTLGIVVFLADYLIIRDFMVLIESKTLLLQIVHCIEALIYNKMSFPFFDMITRILYGNGNDVKSNVVIDSMDKHFLNVNIRDKQANEAIEQANTEEIINKSILGKIVKYNKFSIIEKVQIDSRQVVLKDVATMTDNFDRDGGEYASMEKFKMFLQEKIRCNICMSLVNIEKFYILSCTHHYCFDCIPHLTSLTCPDCRSPIKWGSILTFKERFDIYSYITFNDVKTYISLLASNKNIRPFSIFEEAINKIYDNVILNASSNFQSLSSSSTATLPPTNITAGGGGTSSTTLSSLASTATSSPTNTTTGGGVTAESPTNYYLSRSERIYNAGDFRQSTNTSEAQNTPISNNSRLLPIATPRRSLQRNHSNARRALHFETSTNPSSAPSIPLPNRLALMIESRNSINQQRRREQSNTTQQRRPNTQTYDPSYTLRISEYQVNYDASYLLRTHDVSIMLQNLFTKTIPLNFPNIIIRSNSLNVYFEEWSSMKRTYSEQIDEILKRKHLNEDALSIRLNRQFNLLGVPTAEIAIRRTELMSRHRQSLELIENRFKDNYDQIFRNYDHLSRILCNRVESLFY